MQGQKKELGFGLSKGLAIKLHENEVVHGTKQNERVRKNQQQNQILTDRALDPIFFIADLFAVGTQ